MSNVINRIAVRVWKMLLSMLGVAMLLIGIGAFLGQIFVIDAKLYGREVWAGTYAGIGFDVLILIVVLYVLFYIADYLNTKGRVAGAVQEGAQGMRRWLNKSVPLKKWLNRMVVFGLGFVLAMFVVSARVEIERIRLIRSMQIHTKEHAYLDGAPAYIYYFDPSGVSAEAINKGVFRAMMYSHTVRDNDVAEFIKYASNYYREAQLKAEIALIEVVGYADATGIQYNNQYLSRERAFTVRRLLIDSGIPERLISVRSAGERMRECTRLDGNRRSECLGKARAVEVFLRGNVK